MGGRNGVLAGGFVSGRARAELGGGAAGSSRRTMASCAGDRDSMDAFAVVRLRAEGFVCNDGGKNAKTHE